MELQSQSQNQNIATDSNSNDTEEELLYQHPPEEKIIVTALGETSTHIYNNEGESNGIVLMCHGCGGKKEQYLEGRVAPRLASKYKVITFDWYGHGQSTAIPDYDYTKDHLLEQLHSVVTELITTGSNNDDDDDGAKQNTKKFHLYSFSLGNFLALHYVRLHPELIHKLVLHSPWNAELSAFAPDSLMRYSLSIPGLGHAGACAVSKLYFPYCHDGETFRQILLKMGEGSTKWISLIDDLAKADVPSNVLLICGEVEKPFHKTAQYIHEKFEDKSKMYSWKKADHMTWYDDCDKPVGRFFRDHAYNFLVLD